MANAGHRHRVARLSLLIQLEDKPGALEHALQPFARHRINLTHIESRPGRDGRFDFYVDCEGARGDAAIEAAIAEFAAESTNLLVLDHKQVPWFPRHISELDQVADNTLDAGSELESDHPGFNDPDYRRRRGEIEALARSYRFGDAIPEVAYTDLEVATWGQLYPQLRAMHEAHGCDEYRRIFSALERDCGYRSDHIPQASEVSDFLSARSGFQIRPVAGLLSARDFLSGLAFRVFFATAYLRHHSKPMYTPEPDLVHELIGHAPMLADAAFADLSQEIGLASLGADDAEIERLARCYWHSVEFGLVQEGDERKAYGAGLLSSPGELNHAVTAGEGVHFHDWDPNRAAEQDYPITEYQPNYFVARSLADAKRQMSEYCQLRPRPFYARFHAPTQSIWVDRAVRRERL